MRPLRSYLQNIEFVDLSFHYRLEILRVLPIFPELSLRAILHQTGLERLDVEPFERLFTPALPDDPTALRRYQRPAPPFAFQPRTCDLSTTATDRGIISCRLFGDGILFLDDLIKTMEEIQPYLFSRRQRDGHLDAVSAVDAAGEDVTIWEKGMKKCAEPPRITAAWRFDTLPTTNNWRLEIITPARLLVHKKPLFQPELRHLLPFILRRVTANCYFCNHTEIEGVSELLAMDRGIEKEESHLYWHDWRNNVGDGVLTELGGVCGQLLLTGHLPDDVIDLLHLGSLMNIGKGAAYGAGAFRLVPAGSD